MVIGGLIDNLPDILSGVIDAGLPWLRRYGLFAVGLGLMTETLLFTGLWIPGYGILVAAGFLIGAGEAPAWAVIPVAWGGGLVGDMLSYLLGRWWGQRLLRRHQAMTHRVRRALEREGPFLLLTYHFTPLLRAVVPCVAGSFRYDLRRWLRFDPVGLLAWELTALTIGYCAHGALYSQGNFVALILNALATLLVIVITWRLHRSYRALSLSGDDHALDTHVGGAKN